MKLIYDNFGHVFFELSTADPLIETKTDKQFDRHEANLLPGLAVSTASDSCEKKNS